MRRITPILAAMAMMGASWLLAGGLQAHPPRYPLQDLPDRPLSDIAPDSPIFAHHPPTHRVIYKPARTSDRLYPVEVNHWWGLMNQSGQLVVFPRFQWTDFDYDHLSRVVIGGKTGFVSALGEVIIDPIYPYADRFAEGYAVVGATVKGKRKFGFIDRRGKFIFPIKLDAARRFRDGLAVVRVGARCGYINTAGKFAVKPRFAAARSLHEGLAAVRFFNHSGKPGPWGYIDKSGRVVMRDKTGRITGLGDFHDGLARVRVGRAWGYIGRGFQMRIKPRFEDARDFTGGVAAVKARGRWGYINKTGDAAVKARFAFADDFDAAFALIGIPAKSAAGGSSGRGKREAAPLPAPGAPIAVRYGYVNRVASQGIAPQFAAALPFFRDLARVSQAPSFGYIDQAGHVVWDPREAQADILDLRLGAALRARLNRLYHGLGTTRLYPPPPRPPQHKGYPPDYRYRDALPLPKDGLDPHADHPSPQPR